MNCLQTPLPSTADAVFSCTLISFTTLITRLLRFPANDGEIHTILDSWLIEIYTFILNQAYFQLFSVFPNLPFPLIPVIRTPAG